MVKTNLALLLRVGVRHKRSLQVGAALSGNDGIVVVSLGNEKRGAVRLAPSLDWTRTQALRVEAALAVDPAGGARVAHEDLVFRQLSRHTPCMSS